MNIKLKIYSVFSGMLLLMSVFFFSFGLVSVQGDFCTIIEWSLWGFSSSMMSVSLVFDWMSLMFLGSVCLISGSIMEYSEYYMEGELNYFRFVFILFMFIISMWVLIVSPNMISLLLGWDGLGLSSYGLVIFYQSESSCNAGMITVLSNRIGDVAILLSIGLMLSYGSWDFYKFSNEVNYMVVFLIILASVTKSAQIPFSAWLPAAMAAPTPVSALVHSSTLVTAGVYLLIRFSEPIYKSGAVSLVVWISVMTMLMAGLGALFEGDMKKVIALSTLSQLGLMIMILMGGMKELAFFHLITHAMFKSSLFMCAGFMIHKAGGSQDSRVMSGFSVSSPTLGVLLSGTNLALCGFPFMAGFYSKDVSLEYMVGNSENSLLTMMIILGTGLTVAYSLRVMYLSSLSLSTSKVLSDQSDFSTKVLKSVSILFLGTIFSGFLMYWVAVPVSVPMSLYSSEKWYVVIVSLVGGVVSHMLMQNMFCVKGAKLKISEGAVSLMWYLPFVSTKHSSLLFMMSGYSGMKLIDMGWLENYGGQGGQMKFMGFSEVFQKSQGSGMVQNYMVSVLLSGVIILSILGL